MACLPTLEIESGGFGFGRRRAFRPGGQSIDGLRQSTPITASQGHQTFRSIDRSIFTPRQSVPKRRSPRSWQPAHSLTSVMMFRGFGVHSEEASCRSPALRTSHTLLSGANHPPPPLQCTRFCWPVVTLYPKKGAARLALRQMATAAPNTSRRRSRCFDSSSRRRPRQLVVRRTFFPSFKPLSHSCCVLSSVEGSHPWSKCPRSRCPNYCPARLQEAALAS